MNKVRISKEEILQTAKTMALASGMQALNMRDVAKRCGIAVGSIYHYFPTKADLSIAVVGSVWQEIFHPALFQGNVGFLPLVERLLLSIQDGTSKYPSFFAAHPMGVEDKSKGRAAMEGTFEHIRASLVAALCADPATRQSVWTETFTPEAFAGLVLDLMRVDVMDGTSRAAFLKTLITYAIY